MKLTSVIALICAAIFLTGCNPPPSMPNTAKPCSDFTKDGPAACVDASIGKTCVFDFDTCFEETDARKKFRAEDNIFEAAVPVASDSSSAAVATDNVLGAYHGTTPEWDRLCLGGTKKSLHDAVAKIKVQTFKGRNSLVIDLDCSRGGGASSKTFSFALESKPVDDNAVLLRLMNIGASIRGDIQGFGPKDQDLVNFFVTMDWLYSSKKATLYGVAQLGKFSDKTVYKKIDLQSEDDFDKAFSYARDKGKGNGESISDKVEAISFEMKKI